jgi:catechol 2,3-dioxygenase-like lactoylglutathione lyase family enzyme
MFKDLTSSAIVAASDLDRAKRFYGEILGLVLDADTDVLSYRTGATKLLVYRSDSAGTNRANAVVWGAAEGFDE